MANLTQVAGTFNFDKDFYQKNKALIDKYFGYATLNADYGIADVNNEENGTFDFYANGRWSMENILDWCFAPQNGEEIVDDKTINELYRKLVTAMRKAHAEVLFDYTDYDSGNFFIKESDIVTAKNTDTFDKNGEDFDHQQVDQEDLGMDDKSLIENDQEEGIIVDNTDQYTQNVINDIIDVLTKYIELTTGNKVNKPTLRNKFIDFVDRNEPLNGGFQQFRIDDPASWLASDGAEFGKEIGVLAF